MMGNCGSMVAPAVEALLDAAHREYGMLRVRRDALLRYGIAADHLPEDIALMAFALLGDHDRSVLVEELASYWQMLRSKGLVRAVIADVSTPELRLLTHVLPLTDAIDGVWQRMQEAIEASDAPLGVLRCATRIKGLWGQPACLHFSSQDVAYVLITPDVVFALQPTLLAADRSGQCMGYFSFPVDDGAITFTLLRQSGEIFRHIVHSVVEEME